MTNETIADIVREMREYRIDECDRNWCDRIEAAAKRDVEDTQGLVEDNRQLAVDLDAMKAENDRLRAALNEVCKSKDEMIRQRCEQINRLNAAIAPVLAVNIDGMDSYCRVNCEELLKSIVREAQRIYNAEMNDAAHNRVAKKCMEGK